MLTQSWDGYEKFLAAMFPTFATAITAQTNEKLRELRLLWRPTRDSDGYAHSSLVYAACKLLVPPPENWTSKALWLVFYDLDELDPEPPKEIQNIVRQGFALYQAEKDVNDKVSNL